MQVPADFEYAQAGTVEETLALLSRYGPDARVVAGGHSLIPMMKLRLAPPEALIDINGGFQLCPPPGGGARGDGTGGGPGLGLGSVVPAAPAPGRGPARRPLP